MKKQHRNDVLWKITLLHKPKDWIVNALFWCYSSKNSNIIKGFFIYLCGLWWKMYVGERLAIAVKAEDGQFMNFFSFFFFLVITVLQSWVYFQWLYFPTSDNWVHHHPVSVKYKISWDKLYLFAFSLFSQGKCRYPLGHFPSTQSIYTAGTCMHNW